MWDEYAGLFHDSDTSPIKAPPQAPSSQPPPAGTNHQQQEQPKERFNDPMEAFTDGSKSNLDEIDDELANLSLEERAAHVMARLEVGSDGIILERDVAHLSHMIGDPSPNPGSPQPNLSPSLPTRLQTCR